MNEPDTIKATYNDILLNGSFDVPVFYDKFNNKVFENQMIAENFTIEAHGIFLN